MHFKFFKMEQELLSLWKIMSTDPKGAEEASKQVYKYLKNIDSIYPLISIAQNVNEPVMKYYSFTFIHFWTRSFMEENEYLVHIIEPLYQLAEANIHTNGIKLLIDSILVICTMNKIAEEPMINLLVSMFQQKQYGVGFYSAASMMGIFCDSFFGLGDFVMNLLNCSIELMNENKTDINDVYIFLKCFFESEDKNIVNYSSCFPKLANSISLQCPKILQSGNTIEAVAYFEMICSIIEFVPTFLHSYLVELIHALPSYLINQEIEPSVRVIGYTVIEALSEHDMEFIYNNLNDYLNFSIKFSLELCEESPESQDYSAISGFLSIISTLSDEDENIPTTIFGVIQSLIESENIQSYLVAILIIDSCFEGIEAEFMDIFDSFEKLIIKSINSRNILLIDQACNLILTLIKNDCELGPQMLDIFEDSLLDIVSVSIKVLEALSELYDSADKEPKNLDHTLSVLLNHIQSSNNLNIIEKTCETIGIVIHPIYNIDQKYYDIISPYLNQLIRCGNTSSLSTGIMVYSSFAFSSPKLIFGEVTNLCNIFYEALSQQDDFNLILTVVTTIQNFVDIYTETVSPFIPKFFEKIDQLLNTESKMNMEEDIDCDSPEFEIYQNILTLCLEMRGQLLITLATFYHYYPSILSSQANEIVHQIELFLSSEYPHYHNCAIKSFEEFIPGLILSGIDPTPAVSIFLNSINDAEDVQTVVDIWITMCSIISGSGKQLLQQCGNLIIEYILSTLKLQKSIYKESSKKNILNRRIATPLLTSIIRFFFEYGRDGAQYVEPILHAVLPLTTGQSKYCKGPAVRTVAAILTIFPEFKEDIYKTAFTVTISLVNSSLVENRSCSFDALNYLLHVGSRPIQDVLDRVLSSVRQVISKAEQYPNGMVDSAVMLWGSIVTIFEIEPEEAELDLVLSKIPPSQTTINMKYLSTFMSYAYRHWPEKVGSDIFSFAVNIFACDDYIFRQTDTSELKLYSTILLNEDFSNIQNNLCYHQYRISLLTSHLSNFR